MALPGCPAADFCEPADDSAALFTVRPPDRVGGATNSPFVFTTIQDALDAAGSSPTTVCVAEGVYHERLTVPAGVHLLGAGTSSVRLRPVHAQAIPHPAFVDQVLLTLAPTADADVRVEGIHVGGAAVCADLVGPGTATLDTVQLADCAVGLRVTGGTAVLQDTTLTDHSHWALHARGADSVLLDGGVNVVRSGAAARPAEEQPVFPGTFTKATELDAIDGAGAIRVIDSDRLLVQDASVHANWYSAAMIRVDGTDWTVRDAELDVRAIVLEDGEVRAGDGPAVLSEGGVGLLSSTSLRSDGQSLVRTDGADADLTLLSVAWDARGVSDAMPTAAGAAVEMTGGGTLVGWHLTLLGPVDVAPLRFGADVWLDVANTLAWGHGDGFGLAAEAAVLGPGVRYSLFEDGSLAGEGMLPPADPDLRDAPDHWTPTDTSPLRCAGSPEFVADPDLHGDPRPFEPGKPPDIGAVERQEPCP